MGMKQIWDGKNIPPVGCEVLIHLASINKWVARTVQGYEIWPSVYENDTAHHRINIKFEDNVRLLCDVRPLDWREPD